MTDSKLFRDMKTMKYILTLACVALGITFVACESDVQEQLKNGDKEQITHQPLGDMEIHPMGDKVTISFTSTVDWELGYICSDGVALNDILDTNESTIKWTGSAGTTSFTVAVKEYLNADGKVSNAKGEERWLKLLFCDAASGVILSEHIISQRLPYLIVNGHDVNNTFSLDYADTSKDIIIESNIDWEVTLSDSENSFDLRGGDKEVFQPTTFFGNQTLTLEPEEDGYNYSTETKSATLSISPCSRSFDANDKPVTEVVDTWEYSVVQDYRVMFLVADLPTEDNWLTLPHINATNPLSPYGTDYLLDAMGKSSAEAEFYCIYDMNGDRNAPNMSVNTDSGYTNDATLSDEDEPFKVDEFDGRIIYAQKYIAEVITPNTVLSKNREIPCSLTDNDTTESVQPFTIIQDPFNFTVQYDMGNDDWGEVPLVLFFGNEAYNTKKFKVENNDGLTWSVSKEGNGFVCNGVALNQKNDGNAEFEIQTSGINYSLSSELTGELTISATLEDPSGVHEVIEFTDMNVKLKQEAFLFAFADVNDAKQTLAVDEETASVKFNSYGELKVVARDSWLEADVTPGSKENEYTIELTIIDPNTGFENQTNQPVEVEKRSATVEIVSKVHADNNAVHGLAEHTYTRIIEINQKGYVFKVYSLSQMIVTADGGNLTIKVECSDSYSVSTGSADWISTEISGNIVTVTVAKNETPAVREGIITVTDNYNNKHEIKVTQDRSQEPEKEPEDDNGGEVIE